LVKTGKRHHNPFAPLPRLLQLNLLVLLWSLTGILGEVVTLDPPALVFWRTAIAGMTFFTFCRFRRPHQLRISARHFWAASIAGFVLGIHWLCFFWAIAVSNVSMGLAGFAATSLFTALLEPLSEKRRPDTRQVLLALLVGGGILLIAAARTTVPNPHFGLLLALLGALLAAIYSIFSKQLVVAQVPGPTIMVYQIPAACLATFVAIAVVPGFSFELPTTTDWPPILTLALACTFLAYLWYAHLLKSLTIYTINLAINFEPIWGMLMAAAFFQEYEALGPLFYLGTLTILLANYLHSRNASTEMA
jgi:drug/metabolite transporter (DMT)-like permease